MSRTLTEFSAHCNSSKWEERLSERQRYELVSRWGWKQAVRPALGSSVHRLAKH